MPDTPSRTPRRHGRVASAFLCAALGFAVAVGTGCASSQTPAPVVNKKLIREANENVALAIAATRRGDLDEAERYTAEAHRLAQNPEQTARARSLDQLLAGARAMSVGDAEGAGRSWARIPDRKLRQEVTVMADRMGIEVPVVVANP